MCLSACHTLYLRNPMTYDHKNVHIDDFYRKSFFSLQIFLGGRKTLKKIKCHQSLYCCSIKFSRSVSALFFRSLIWTMKYPESTTTTSPPSAAPMIMGIRSLPCIPLGVVCREGQLNVEFCKIGTVVAIAKKNKKNKEL